MKEKIKSYFEKLKPEQLGLKGKKVKVKYISKLGQGTGNLNYLVVANNNKFVFRLNMQPDERKKSRKEFNSLKIADKYKIGPKPIFIDESKKVFDTSLIIISYIEGKTTDKTKDYLKPKMYKKIGELCGKLHSFKLTNDLKKLDYDETFYGYKNQMGFVKKEFLNYLNTNIKDKSFVKMINETFDKQAKKIPKEKYNVDAVLSQGDFCEQNIVVNKGEYKLIDFEYLGLADRANHLSSIFSDFGRPFDEEQKELFLKEYLKYNKVNEKELREKVEIWIPLKLFKIFLWSLKHALIIKEGKMHPEFYKNDKMQGNIDYSKTMFKRCLRFGVIDKKYNDFDIQKILE
jgi:thiamine kinase-like enzyme